MLMPRLQEPKRKAKSKTVQTTLWGNLKERQWNRKKLWDQLFFIATHHDFLKKDLQHFCKTKNMQISGTKEALVKRIWNAWFDFAELKEGLDPPRDQDSGEWRFLVERIQLKPSPQLFQVCHLAKNLYNQGNYLIQTALEDESGERTKKRIGYLTLEKQLRESPNYRHLPSQVAQQTLRQLTQNWDAFFKALEDWKAHPEKYRQKPAPPGYKPKEGAHLVIFTRDECRIKYDRGRNKQVLYFNYKAKLPPIVVNGARVSPQTLRHVRILPRHTYYVLEIVYKRKIEWSKLEDHRTIGIDIGVRNLVTVVNNIGLDPWIVRGRTLMAINQYFNKLRSKLQARNSAHGNVGTTKRLYRLSRVRENKITDFFHKLSRAIVDYCITHEIGTIVIGYNETWKQRVNLGRRTNQNFAYIPFLKLIHQVKYKAELVGIHVWVIDEAHTSKCSFLDEEPIRHHDQYVGKRGVYRSKKDGGKGGIHTGLFQTASGVLINSDVNGAYNILKKAVPNAFADGIEGLGLVPRSVKFTELKQFVNLKSTQHTIPKGPDPNGREGNGGNPNF